MFNVDLLSHFPDPVAALRAMAAGLRTDGVICLEVGIVAGLRPLWYRLGGGVGFPHHLWLYSEGGLRALFAKADLEVCELRRFGLAPSVLLMALRRGCWNAIARLLPPRRSATGQRGRLDSAYDRIQSILRYRVGRFMPGIGQQTALVTLRKRAA